ncbi:MAG TPA: hypothetical protein VH619_15015 [Verrucomicrobiae bacterium]|jgi:hypothetical protein|nr:hypothetical protein [Verrucomicrobiae bacterium]
MDPRQHIAAILKRWLEMTHAENQAIQAAAWPALRQTQEDKAKLRATLAQAMEKWNTANPGDAKTQPFRNEVAQLLALETRNSDLLAARKRQAAEKKVLLEQALYNLRRVRSSYAFLTPR